MGAGYMGVGHRGKPAGQAGKDEGKTVSSSEGGIFPDHSPQVFSQEGPNENPEKGPEKSSEKGSAESPLFPKPEAIQQGPEQGPEQGSEEAPAQGLEQVTERGLEQAPARISSSSPEHAALLPLGSSDAPLEADSSPVLPAGGLPAGQSVVPDLRASSSGKVAFPLEEAGSHPSAQGGDVFSEKDVSSEKAEDAFGAGVSQGEGPELGASQGEGSSQRLDEVLGVTVSQNSKVFPASPVSLASEGGQGGGRPRFGGGAAQGGNPSEEAGSVRQGQESMSHDSVNHDSVSHALIFSHSGSGTVSGSGVASGFYAAEEAGENEAYAGLTPPPDIFAATIQAQENKAEDKAKEERLKKLQTLSLEEEEAFVSDEPGPVKPTVQPASPPLVADPYHDPYYTPLSLKILYGLAVVMVIGCIALGVALSGRKSQTLHEWFCPPTEAPAGLCRK
ncbi:hypothetical protein [Entomobacter blattae]|uniref:Uncharacterized protein n=1 Tax=Entomobacter blattae TaxID=2762277 RepID=A0A7H1NR22_9PROT|nr:hypothetical protein [Entomobacter blattae]QNT78232.1 hypothetical protein JGUZn3_10030 [Entomobacter blattae]